MNVKHGKCTILTHCPAQDISSVLPIKGFLILKYTAYLLHDKNSSRVIIE